MMKSSALPSSATPTEPGIHASIIAAPGFSLGVRGNDRHLLRIEFLPPGDERIAPHPLAREAARQLKAWLKRADSPFDLPLASAGSPFRQRVWQQIAAIPPGETRSYGDLARAIGSAPRAVGGACGDNPYPVVVPCHRVVAAAKGFNQGLGGFAHQRSGFLLDVKQWLLSHERALAHG